MKSYFSVVAAVACLILGVSGVWAGDYHYGATLICSDCHVMHGSQSHGYNADGTGFYLTPNGGPHEYLLRDEETALCLSCHNNQAFAPDVLGPGTSGDIRQAGALNQLGGEGLDATGHTLGTTDIAPGSNPPWSDAAGLKCTDCHNQHGYNPNGNPYRNLMATPGNTAYPGVVVDYAVSTNDLTKDVYEIDPAEYDISDVWFNEPDPTKSGYADFCKGCHTEFHGDKGSAEMGGATGTEWVRHPTNDADIGDVGGGHSDLAVYAALTNKAKVMHPNEGWNSTDPLVLDGATPSCMTCHKGHGNQNAFGLIYMSGTGTVTEEGDDGTQMRDLCRQCHVQ